MSVIGDTSYITILSTAVSSGEPSGTRVYILTEQCKINVQSLHQIKHLVYGSAFYNNFGKRRIMISIDGYIPLSTVNTVLQVINQSLLANSSNPATPLYCWVKRSANEYIVFPEGSSLNYKNYLYGYVTDYGLTYDPNGFMVKLGFTFEECAV